jgi:tetratricopeptide (TPR) repeat protein
MPAQSFLIGVDPAIQTTLARHHLAAAALAMGDAAAAEAEWRKALAHDPSFGPASLGLLEVYHRQGRRAEIADLMRAVERNGTDSSIHVAAQARLKAFEGDYEGACKIIVDKLDNTSRTLWLRLLLSEMNLKNGKDPESARLQLQKALMIMPTNLDVKRRLAKLNGRLAAT